MAISLEIKGPDGEQRKVEFDQAKVTIGSDTLCDLCIQDDGVDRQQLVIVRRADGVELFDIGTTGGVLVNGTPQHHVRIAPGDEIWVGATVLSLVEEASAAVEFTERDSNVRAEVKEAAEPAVVPTPAVADDRFALLDQVRGLINTIGSGEDTFTAILDTLFNAVPVRRGFIALVRPDAELSIKAHRNIEKAARGSGPIEVSRTLVGRVLETGCAVLTSDAEADPSLQAAQSIHRLRIKAAICVPLKTADKVIGFLYGDNRERPGALTKDHLTILNALASVAAAAVETGRLIEEFAGKRRLEQALGIARSNQRNFLPGEPPESDWLDIWGHSDSCDETGGDYYDFFKLPAGRLGVVIADVSGHGVGSALLMASVRAALRALVSAELSGSKLVARLNDLIHADVNDGRFITFFLGRFDKTERKFEHVGAGHTPPVFFRKRDNSTYLVMSKGPPLGIMSGMEFEPGTPLPLASGDVLLFTTDGIMEASNNEGEMFGLDRLRKLVVERAAGSAQELIEAIREEVDRFVSGRKLLDDATLVAVKVR